MDRAVSIIEKAVGMAPGHGPVRRVLVEPAVDSQGNDALSVVLVLEDNTLSGAEAIEIFYKVQQDLAATGDERFPIIEFSTEKETELDGGSQP